MTTRRLPRVGEPVTVLYLSGPVDGVITQVTDDLHGLEVLTEDGASLQFRLNEATARFVSSGGDAPARLFFRSDDEQL